ncbi:nucleoside 2-deoxyribosyltransferase [soil metagenome]
MTPMWSAGRLASTARLDPAGERRLLAAMRKLERVFLAGPDRFAPEAAFVQARQKALCEAAGLTAVMPPEAGEIGDDGELHARAFFVETIARLRSADALIANFTPWRGPGAEPATAYLAGFAGALGKPVVAYMNVLDEAEADHRDRVEGHLGAVLDEQGVWRDPDGARIEDLGLPEAALLWAEARRFMVIVTDEPMEDVTGLELCLDALRLYAD